MPRDLKQYALTYLVMSVPLLGLANHPIFVAALWGALICTHIGLIRAFGRGFRLEGAVVVVALSILMTLFGRAYFAISAQRDDPVRRR